MGPPTSRSSCAVEDFIFMVMIEYVFVLLSRRGNPWLLCAFDTRGYEACMRVHYSHVIAKWSRAYTHFTWLGGCPVYGENGASAIPRKPRILIQCVRASAEHRRRAGSKRSVGGRRTPRNLPRIRSKLYRVTPIGTAPPKHNTESGTLFNHRYSGICAR